MYCIIKIEEQDLTLYVSQLPQITRDKQRYLLFSTSPEDALIMPEEVTRTLIGNYQALGVRNIVCIGGNLSSEDDNKTFLELYRDRQV